MRSYLGLFWFFLSAAAVASQSDTLVPDDACLLEVQAPEARRITVDGRDYGPTRRFTFDGLARGRGYGVVVKVAFQDAPEVERRVFLRGGQRVVLPLLPPGQHRPELVLQSGHASSVSECRFSPDDRFALTASADSTAILWDLASGRSLRAYAGHEGRITGLAFAEDGRRIVTGSSDDRVIVWDRDSGARLRSLQPDTCYALAVAADGRSVLVGEHAGRASLWDLATGRKLRRLEGSHTKPVCCVALSPDGRRALTGADDRTAVLWDLAGGSPLRTLGGHAAELAFVAFTPDGRRLLTGSGRCDRTAGSKTGELLLWDASGSGPLARAERCVHNACIAPDGRTIAIEEHCGTQIVILDGETLAEIAALHGGHWALAFSPDGKRLLDGESVWDLATRKVIQRFSGQRRTVDAVYATPDTRRLLMDSGYSLVVFDVPAGKEEREFPMAEDLASSRRVALRCDGRQVFLAGYDERRKQAAMVSFDLATGAEIARHPLAPKSLDEFMLSSAGDRCLVTQDDVPAVWDVATGRRLARVDPGTMRLHRTALSPDGLQVLGMETTCKDLAVEHGTKRVRWGALWDAGSGEAIRSLELIYDARQQGGPLLSTAYANCAAFTPDASPVTGGKETYQGSTPNNGVFLIWKRDGTSARAFRGHTGEVRHVVFTPDGRRAASHADDKSTIVWDIESGVPLRTFHTHTADDMTPPLLTADGERLLTRSADGSLRLYDVATGDELVRLVRLAGQKTWLTVTPEGLFDGPAEARKQVSFRVGQGLEVVAVDRFFQDFYRPGLLSEILTGIRPMPEARFAAKAAPRVRIDSDLKSGPIETPTVKFRVEVTDRGGGVKGPWLLHNGSPVLASTPATREGKLLKREFTVPLVEGENRLEVRAASEDGSWESEPALLVLRYQKPLDPPRLFLVAVGVSRYAQASMSLRYAAADAQSLAEVFTRRGPALYGKDKVHAVQLLDEKGTRAEIKNAVGDVAARARAQDTLLVFLAGHGTMIGQRFYFIPHEFKHAGKLEEDIRRQGLPGDELEEAVCAVPALKRVLIYDTCQSGAVLGLRRTARDPFAFQGALERMSRATGSFTLAATSASSAAHEVEQLQHGVLTYALLAGLGAVQSGPLAGQTATHESKDHELLEVRQWFSYAQDKVPLLTKLLLGEEQLVGFCGQGTNFPLLPAR